MTIIQVQRPVAKHPLVRELREFRIEFILADTCGLNECCSLGIMINKEDIYRNNGRGKEEDKIMIVSFNINGFRNEIWKEKNDSVRNFLH